jgi:hypothetical protein
MTTEITTQLDLTLTTPSVKKPTTATNDSEKQSETPLVTTEEKVEQPTEPSTEPSTDTATPKSSEEEESGAIFQAVGVIVGKVSFSEDNRNTITISNNEYRLFYIPRKRKVLDALKKEIESSGNQTQRLVVYPRVLHFPRKDQPHQIAFQLVGFDQGREEDAVSRELGDFEFRLCGLWQFIPVCKTPCVSVFRNFTRERLEIAKQATPASRVRFMKASHLPLLWKDAPVAPFRFNPKLEKEQQGKPMFVSLKAKFLPGRNVFGFSALLAPPLTDPPKFFKARKTDKAEAMAANKKAKIGEKPARSDKAPPTDKAPQIENKPPQSDKAFPKAKPKKPNKDKIQKGADNPPETKS